MRQAGNIGRRCPRQFGARLVQDCCNTIRDQIGRLNVDFIDIFIREFGIAGVDVLQRHQKDRKRRPRAINFSFAFG